MKVIAATRGTPADQAGIKSGDFITHIDGRLFYGGTLDEAVDRMRGQPGTSVRITIVRPGRERPFDVNITRAIIDIPAVRAEVRDRVGILTVTTFNRDTTEATQRRDRGHRAPARRAAARLCPRPALQPRRPARPGGRPVRPVPRARRGRLAARPAPDRHRALSTPARATPPTACRSSCWSTPAPPRPPRSSPRALQDHRRADRDGRPHLRQGLGADPAAARRRQHRAPAHHRALLHAGGPLGAGRRDHPGHRWCRRFPTPTTGSRNRVRESDLRRHLVNEAGVQDDLIQDDGRPDPRFAATAEQLTAARHHRLPAPLCAADDRAARPDPAAAAGRRRARPAQRHAAEGGPRGAHAARPRPSCWRCSCRGPARAAPTARNIWAASLPARCASGSVTPISRLWPSPPLPLLAGRMPDRGRSFVWLAALAILASGAIGVYHAGVELDYWRASPSARRWSAAARDLLAEIMAAPIVRCDEVQWSFLGISMAGWNAILSLSSALVILWLSLETSPRDPLAPAWRPGDARARHALDAARRPGRRIWRDPHLCRPARRVRRPAQIPGLIAAHGRAGAAASQAFRRRCSPRAASGRPCSSRSGPSPAMRSAPRPP